jgi:hypothetical protein
VRRKGAVGRLERRGPKPGLGLGLRVTLFLAPFSSAFYLVRMLSNKPKPRLTRCSALRINYSTTGWLEATVSLITQTHPNSC